MNTDNELAMDSMEEEMEAGGALPERRERNPIIYVIVYQNADGTLQVIEKDTRKLAKEYINEELDPHRVLKLYRVSAVIPLNIETKIVATF